MHRQAAELSPAIVRIPTRRPFSTVGRGFKCPRSSCVPMTTQPDTSVGARTWSMEYTVRAVSRFGGDAARTASSTISPVVVVSHPSGIPSVTIIFQPCDELRQTGRSRCPDGAKAVHVELCVDVGSPTYEVVRQWLLHVHSHPVAGTVASRTDSSHLAGLCSAVEVAPGVCDTCGELPAAD
jgi:hypothetical protein